MVSWEIGITNNHTFRWPRVHTVIPFILQRLRRDMSLNIPGWHHNTSPTVHWLLCTHVKASLPPVTRLVRNIILSFWGWSLRRSCIFADNLASTCMPVRILVHCNFKTLFWGVIQSGTLSNRRGWSCLSIDMLQHPIHRHMWFLLFAKSVPGYKATTSRQSTILTITEWRL